MVLTILVASAVMPVLHHRGDPRAGAGLLAGHLAVRYVPGSCFATWRRRRAVQRRLSREREAGKSIVVTSHRREDVDLLAGTVHRVDRMTLERLPGAAAA